jgi:hypothetical protein
MATPTIEKGRPPVAENVGTIPTSLAGMSVEEYGVGPFRLTRISFNATPIALTDNAGVVAYGGAKIYDFPAGMIQIMGAVADIRTLGKSSAGVNDNFDGDFSLGTATAGNDATLLTTEANVLPSTATPQAVSGVTTAKGISRTAITRLTDSSGGTASDTLAAITGSYVEATIENTVASLAAKINALIDNNGASRWLALDGTTTAPDLYINFLVDDADHDVTTTACNLLLTGDVYIAWFEPGQYA